MKKKKIFGMICVIMILLFTLTGCGEGNKEKQITETRDRNGQKVLKVEYVTNDGRRFTYLPRYLQDGYQIVFSAYKKAIMF